MPELDERGRPDPWELQMVQLRTHQRRLAMALVISTLEPVLIGLNLFYGDVALVVVIGLKLFYGDVAGGTRTRIQVLPSCADTRCHGSVHNKFMTTRFPPSEIVMELACC